MSTQPELLLEDTLVNQLTGLGYSLVALKDENDLNINLKSQLEKHNHISLSDKEFSKVLNHLNKGNVFERAKILRDKMQLTKDNGDIIYIEFMNLEHWCQNLFQVTRQLNMEGSYKNRYDVTLLVNGLPLVQIELKRRGLELKEAFNQINRYQRHSFWANNGLFQYVQFFVISNGVNTKYYANNRKESFKQTFYWADKENRIITQLDAFTKDFLEPCHMSKMVAKYTVLQDANKALMIFRPYQYYATEAIIERVKNTNKNGFIWHTTGSGKTLTSFKASQVLMKLPQVHKVVFVVDRKDLDYQTTKEFNSFSNGSVDGTDDTHALVKQFSDDTKLIVTTIQKLNSAITQRQHFSKMEKLKDKKIIFIFDECHRTQFGETHKRIKAFFENIQMFGFTGTPIFTENAIKNEHGKRTTTELFDECLHKYVITDAIKDENVLKFSIEYVGRYKQKEESKTLLDIEVEDINTKELLESDDRLDKITDYIIANHNRKTYNREFTGMFCVGSVEMLIKYYRLLQQKKVEGKHNLRIATIFSYVANEEDKDANGMVYEEELGLAAEPQVGYGINAHSRDNLEEFIGDYNKMYNTKFTTKDSQSFYNYYNDIAKKVKEREIDILLVVNMFLTGFDSKTLNTLYVDKNLKFHGLIQAFSRTNRILNDLKSQGNIVCFRNLKSATDDAITLFSNKEARDVILMQPYENYVAKFNEALQELKNLTPDIESVNELPSEVEELAFIRRFRELLRLRNILSVFTDFTFDDLGMSNQEFDDYKSKYLDLYDKVRTNNQSEKVSILDDVDFELELVHRDTINVAYILHLLSKLKGTVSLPEFTKQKKTIIDLLSGDVKLRSKRELIEKFILENLPNIKDADSVSDAFDVFWGQEQELALEALCKEENIQREKLLAMIGEYLFTERKPLSDEIIDLLETKPKLLERKKTVERVITKIMVFIETFLAGVGE
jgi:type I restriction enzyme R subunit